MIRSRVRSSDPLAGDLGRADVGGHDQHRVGEVDRPALAVGEAAVVHDLQQHVEGVGVGLLDLVEQDHRVGPAAYGLGELTALVVADVAGGRADQAAHRVLLHVLRHIDADDRRLGVEHELGQRPRELGLADAGRAEEEEAADRAVGGRRARHASGATRRRPPRRPRPGRSPARAGDPSIRISFSTSPSINRLTGIPVHLPDDLGDVGLGHLVVEDRAALRLQLLEAAPR